MVIGWNIWTRDLLVSKLAPKPVRHEIYRLLCYTCTADRISTPLPSLQTGSSHISMAATISNLAAKYTVWANGSATGNSQQYGIVRDTQRRTSDSLKRNGRICHFKKKGIKLLATTMKTILCSKKPNDKFKMAKNVSHPK